MPEKNAAKKVGEYVSFEEYRKAFFPKASESGEVDTSDPTLFGAELARQILRETVLSQDKMKQGGRHPEQRHGGRKNVK